MANNYWTKGLPYFSKSELRCKGTGIIKLDNGFASRLLHLRQEWGSPLTPTSVCRTTAYNTEVGGHTRSLHLTESVDRENYNGTMAGDFYWDNWPLGDQVEFYTLANALDWSCGLSQQFIHLDRRVDLKGYEVTTFDYDDWDNRFARIGDLV